MRGRPLPRIHYDHEMDSRERRRPQWTLHGNSRPTATPTPASSARSRSACRAPAGSAASPASSATSAPCCPPSAIGRWRPRQCRRSSASRTPHHEVGVPRGDRRGRRTVRRRGRAARGRGDRRARVPGLPRRTQAPHPRQQRAGAHEQGDKTQVAGGLGVPEPGVDAAPGGRRVRRAGRGLVE